MMFVRYLPCAYVDDPSGMGGGEEGDQGGQQTTLTSTYKKRYTGANLLYNVLCRI